MIRPGSKERALRMGILMAGDLVIGGGSLIAVVELRRHVNLAFTKSLLPEENFLLDWANILLFALSLVVALGLSGFYHGRMTPRTRPSIITAVVIQAALIAIGGTALARPVPRTVLLAVPLFELVLVPLWRRLLRLVGPIRPRETILLGEPDDVTEALAGLHMAADQRIRVIAHASARLDALRSEESREVLRQAEEVILVSPDADPRVRLELLRIRGPRGYLMLASHVDALLASRTPGWIGDQPLVEVAVSCGFGVSAVVKRSLDIVGGALLIVIGAPVWILASVAILLHDGRPVLIRQQRVGRGGAPYGMWKFRSMHGPAESEPMPANQAVTREEQRITRAGALLRRYHIDELPQLLNVLTGEMSLVGPRPERPELVAAILREVPDFDLRSLVRPGIAGLAQVAAEYDTRPEVKLRYDLMYMCDWSVWLDLRLLLRAVSVSLAGTGR